jgi:hypothetical protein
MGLLRAWVILLTLVAALAAAFAVLAPQMLTRDLDREIDARLERTHHAASLLLRVNARKWIDTSAQVASDAVLVESLNEATRGPSDLAMVHKTVQDRLRYFNERMKVDLVAATDARGRVIARVGLDAAAYKDSIEGYPLVADALRGQRGDDTWPIGGRLYRVAASPVILRDHYVGAVVIGQEATTELAESMKAVLGADVALMLRGRVIASTGNLPILDKLPVASAAHAAELARGARSAPLSIDGWAVILGAFVGEAADHQALFALCTPRQAVGSLPALAASVLRADPASLPWRSLVPIAAAMLLCLVIGSILVSAVAGRPLDKLVHHVQALARGELQRLPEAEHRGRAGVLARALNSTIERIAGRARAEARASAPTAPPLVDPARPAPRLTTPPGSPASIQVTPLPPPAPPPAAFAATVMSPAVPLPALPGNLEPIASVEAAMPTSEFEDRQTRARDWPGAAASIPSSAQRGLFTQSLTPLPPPIVPPQGEMTGSIMAPAVDATAPNEVEPEGESPSSQRRTARAIPTARGFEEQTSVESPSEALLLAAAHGTDEEIEADYRRVFEEFIATRQKCGEALEGVTLDKFIEKLRQNRAQLIQRYGCASVRFQVYVKDGRTALKATPVS